jgi:hypothetical protein
LKAGLELEMPGPADGNDALIVGAVRSARWTKPAGRAVERILAKIAKRMRPAAGIH